MTILLAAVLLLLTSLIPAPAAAQWTHMPAGSTILLDCPMTSITGCPRLVDQYGNLNTQQVSDAADPASPPYGIRLFLPYTGPCGGNVAEYYACANGGGVAYWVAQQPLKELYIGFYFKANIQNGCNLPRTSKDFFAMTYNAQFGAPVMNGYFGTSGCGATKTTFFGHNTGGLNNSHACALDSGLRCNPNRSAGTYQADQMTLYQVCLRAGSGLTARDAIVAWSLDSVWAGVYTNLNYGVNNVNEWQWNKTLDGYGNGQGFTGTLDYRIYHLRIAAPPNGGCAAMLASTGGGSSPPPPPPLPPNRPTNLRVQ